MAHHERRKEQRQPHLHRRHTDEEYEAPQTFLDKAKANPFKTATAILTFVATATSMVYAFINFIATKNDIVHVVNEMIDVAVMKYEDDLMEIEYRVTSHEGTDFDTILVNHYKRRIESLKEMKKEE